MFRDDALRQPFDVLMIPGDNTGPLLEPNSKAGVSAGTDMAFYLVKRLAGRAVAEAGAIQAEYDFGIAIQRNQSIIPSRRRSLQVPNPAEVSFGESVAYDGDARIRFRASAVLLDNTWCELRSNS